MLNPMTQSISSAVSSLYPDMTDYLARGHKKPHGDEWGKWLFKMIFSDTCRYVISAGAFSDCIRSVCFQGREEGALKIIFESGDIDSFLIYNQHINRRMSYDV